MTSMRALTLWQPHATLIALGVKWIETRPWAAPASLIGERFAIHAAARPVTPVPPDTLVVGDFEAWSIRSRPDSHSLGSHPGASYLSRRGVAEMRKLPLGAVVCTARLADCVPMSNRFSDDVRPLLELRDSQAWLWERGRPGWPYEQACDATGQIPYGNFAPNRWAWILADIQALDVPVPARGGQRIWNWEH